MKQVLSFLILLLCAEASYARGSDGKMLTRADSIRIEMSRIRKELRVSDTAFFKALDSLIHYSTDAKFTAEQQALNQKSIYDYLSRILTAEPIRSGRARDHIRFAFSVMDWRHEGTLYANLNSYARFALHCASLFSEDTAGMQIIAKMGEEDPDLILQFADQFATTQYYKDLVEGAVLSDPDYAKRYFFAYNSVAEYAEYSKDLQVSGVYKLFDQYGTNTKAFILYHLVSNKTITVKQADSIAADNKAMIKQMVKILCAENPLGLKSVMREMDFRAVEWVRKTALWPAATITDQFAQFSPDERFAMLAFSYQECNPRMLETYLSVMRKSDLSSICPFLIKNLKQGPLPAFLQALDKEAKLTATIATVNDKDRAAMLQLLSTDERKNEAPPLRDITNVAATPAPVTASAEPAKPVVKTPAPAPPPPAPEPVDPYENIKVEPIHFELTDSAREILKLKKNIFQALQDIPQYLQTTYAKEALLYAASVEPDEVLKKIDLFKGKYWCKDILEKATLNAPINARRYLSNSLHPVTTILGFSSNPDIKKFLKLSNGADYQSRPFLLLDEMTQGKMTLAEATAISNDNNRLFKELMKIVTQKNYIGRYNVESEMNYYALRFVRAINDKVGQSEAVRFAEVDNLSCDEIYYLMVYGREEVFSATFAGLFSRFETKCTKTDTWKANRFISYPHYRSFMALCASYGKLDKFLSLFTPLEQKELLASFATDLEKEADNLTEAATVAETVANTTTNGVLQTLAATIKANYARMDSVQNYNGMAIYGILSALCKDKTPIDKKWFSMTAKRYKVGALTTLANSALTDQKPFVERMYFYDDEDGRDSYLNFIKTYSNASEWRVEQHYSYVKITSVSGTKIEIYANKAELEESGDREIAKIINDNNYTVRCIVHRGHSFHTEATLSRVPSSARFIFVGSCGGFYKLNIALRKAPDAHIISTRQIGIKQINDPIIFSFNEYVRQGKDINWKLFWDEMRMKLGGNALFYDYVPPHKNLESLFVRAYYQIMSE